MLINKITEGWVTQTFDTEQNKFIRQEYFAGAHVDYENTQGSSVNSDLLIVDGKEIYLPFDMVQPDIHFIELLDLDSQPCGILKTNTDYDTLDNLIKKYSELKEQRGAQEFVDFCTKECPNFFFELFFLETERVLEI